MLHDCRLECLAARKHRRTTGPTEKVVAILIHKVVIDDFARFCNFVLAINLLRLVTRKGRQKVCQWAIAIVMERVPLFTICVLILFCTHTEVQHHWTNIFALILSCNAVSYERPAGSNASPEPNQQQWLFLRRWEREGRGVDFSVNCSWA